jgi:hypothetical protein
MNEKNSFFSNGDYVSEFNNNKFTAWEYTQPVTTDMVNSPAHYTAGRYEAIEVIEDAIDNAPSCKQGFLQAQVLKYILRMWHKTNSKEDAEKAQWYLARLIDSLNY